MSANPQIVDLVVARVKFIQEPEQEERISLQEDTEVALTSVPAPLDCGRYPRAFLKGIPSQ